MRKFRFSRFVLISVVTLIFVTSLIFFLFRSNQIRQNVSNTFSDVSLTISGFFSTPISATKTFISDLSSIGEIRNENINLKEENRLLSKNEETVSALKAENDSLKVALQIKESFQNDKFLSGKVLSRSTNSWLEWVTLNVGSKDGVSDGMFVLSDGYLVGTISEVSDSFSVVNLLSNTGDSINIPIKIQVGSDFVFGILSGYDLEREALVVSKLNKRIDIPVGSLLKTSGLDGRSVSDVSIGAVTDVVSHDELNKTVYVKPGTSLDSLSYVSLVGVQNGKD